MSSAAAWLARIRELELDGPVRVMNVCGGHERTVSMSGLRSVLPAAVDIVAGPGCPVCVCPEEDIYLAVQIALRTNARVVTFGDMLRVPATAAKREVRSLEAARAAGGQVVPVASPQEAWREAVEHPDQTVVFFAAGFETTMAPVAARIVEGLPPNLLLLVSGRRTWPAVKMLLDSEAPGFDALVAPGHVATVMGPEEWEPVVDTHGLPVAVSGFTAEHLLVALYSVLRQHVEGERFLDNCYAAAVRPGGNPTARRVLEEAFTIEDATWRGIGTIPASGFTLRERFAAHDARRRFVDLVDESRSRAGAMPAGCDCARVVLGRIRPTACALFGRACTPREPVGPCMVSDEGACRIWWAAGHRAEAQP